ncbi:MAG: hypothetical protein GY715_10765 [Planctomycetes bacterium]|nr:hypothetical protein [Planctomycetota bacterium]
MRTLVTTSTPTPNVPAPASPAIAKAPHPEPGATPAAPTCPAPSGLTAEQLEALRIARRDRRKVNRAAGVAAFSGWTMAAFAFITLLTGIFSLPAFLLGVGMACVSWVEIRGSRSLRRLDLTAPRRLALNQLALGAMLCLYGSWGIYGVMTAPSPYAEHLATGGPVAEMLEPIDALQTMLSVVVYLALIVCGLIATGCTSLYYFTRRSHIDRHLRGTPAWVVETLRAV